jgi:hypothetical protein
MKRRFIPLFVFPFALVILLWLNCSQTPTVPRTIGSLVLKIGHTTYGTRYLELFQSETGTLTEVNVTFRAHFENGRTIEIRRQWDSWEQSETKKVEVRSKEAIDKWDVEGVATIDGAQVRFSARFTPATPDRRTLSQFYGLAMVTKLGACRLEFFNLEPGNFQNVELTIHISYEDGKKTELKQQWPLWKNGEKKSVELPESRAAVEKFGFDGNAVFNDVEKVRCFGEFTPRKENAFGQD